MQNQKMSRWTFFFLCFFSLSSIVSAFYIRLFRTYKAWQEIPADLVANAFKSCGISNALDGTEDEAVWEEEGAGADEADDDVENDFDTDSEQED